MSASSIPMRVEEDGGIVIPAEYCQALDLRAGDEVILRVEDGELRLITLDQALARAQALVRRHVPEGRSLVDEILAERRREAERG